MADQEILSKEDETTTTIVPLIRASSPITYQHSNDFGPHWTLKYSRLSTLDDAPKETVEKFRRSYDGTSFLATATGEPAHEFVVLCTIFGDEFDAADGKKDELAALIRETAADSVLLARLIHSFAQHGPSPDEMLAFWRTGFRDSLLRIADAIERDGNAQVGAESPFWPPEKEWAARTRENVPNAFPDGIANVPINPAINAGLCAIRKGGQKAPTLTAGWRENNGQVVYGHRIKKGGQVLFYFSPAQASGPIPTTDTLWKFVESLSPFTSDVVLAVLAQLCEPGGGDRPKAPLLETIKITADTILQYKGSHRRGEDKQELRSRVHDEMERLRALRFDVRRVGGHNPDTGKYDPTGITWEGDSLFDIVKVERYQETLFKGRDVIETSWSVRAGHWAKWWLNSDARRIWVGRMARAILELDHRQQRPAHQLAKNISQVLIFTGPNSKMEPIVRRIDRLLEDAGELPVPAKRNSNWAGRTRERFDNALLVLKDVGIIMSVTWENDKHGPGDPDRSKGWVTAWLNTKIEITLPELAPALPARPTAAIAGPANKPRRRTKRAGKAQPLTGVDLRQTRTTRGWRQAVLANHLGISTPYLSQIETGKRAPSAALANKISDWLTN